MNGSNTVFFGFSHCYVAFMQVSADGKITYEKPQRLPNGVTYSPSPDVEDYEFFADNIAAYTEGQNNGYTGDLELAKFPPGILARMKGWTIGANGMLVERADTGGESFALIFAVNGDARGRRFVYYNCSAGAFAETFSTTTRTKEVRTQRLGLHARPIEMRVQVPDQANPTQFKEEDGLVIRSVLEYDASWTSTDMGRAAWDKWYDEVQKPIAGVSISGQKGGK